eukprot:CAMPEP_0181202308 /NCGR_PEP_ID=MMETSP1096-20121128/18771_1 /TAXON_ID=156174 ORGANISM="Chrysochromulina ericina, Strain CCMP281" /NCGR_SAMPLE_ID=MMETSP1096 /ASSEMBLY_ACC=CAM_ASM_000453 /LENGTH=67 /DNA_ID=CAMNT_0023292809 /DNA_START=64 /DNA_END=264 /DNA_ORIENTATION=-
MASIEGSVSAASSSDVLLTLVSVGVRSPCASLMTSLSTEAAPPTGATDQAAVRVAATPSRNMMRYGR